MDTNVPKQKTVFVTVGTTLFDALVKAVDSEQCKEALISKGYTNLVIQLGRGTYLPVQTSDGNEDLNVEYFKFSPDISKYLHSADLVISHAGSGSIFETLRFRRPLIVVVNEALMDNHQSELAEELAERNYLICAKPETLAEAILNMDIEKLIPYPQSKPEGLIKSISSFLGFHDD